MTTHAENARAARHGLARAHHRLPKAATSATLLAIPAAVSLNTAIVPPAAAQTLLGPGSYAGLDLANYGPGPVSITAGTTILSSGSAAISGGNGAELDNAGAIAADQTIGISLGAGALVNNAGSISGQDAIRLDQGGSVNNAAGGVINATRYGVLGNNAAVNVDNAGAITAGYDGISLNQGGQITNEVGGYIEGNHIGVFTDNAAGVLNNSGVIASQTGDAASLYGGGSLVNTASGQLQGGFSGAFVGGDAGQLENDGVINGASFGVYLNGASQVTNHGEITGGLDGVLDIGAGGQITNDGQISGGKIGVRLFPGGQLDNSGMIYGGKDGVVLCNNVTVINEAAGVINGGEIGLQAASGDIIQNAGLIEDAGVAGVALAGNDQLTNTGSIQGVIGVMVTGDGSSIVNSGVIASTQAGGDAVSLQGSNDVLTLDTGTVIVGDIASTGTGNIVNLDGFGQLASDITGFASGALNIAQAANWVASGNWTIGQVTNSGTFQPGIIGTPLNLTGDFTQTSTGTMRVAVSPSAMSEFNIDGSATLGGRLVYVLAPGAYQPTQETFLTATGGVTGAFASTASVQTQTQTQTQTRTQPLQTQALMQTFSISQDPATQPATQPTTQAAPLVLVSDGSSVRLIVNQSFTVAPQDASLSANANQAALQGADGAAMAGLAHAGEGSWVQTLGAWNHVDGAFNSQTAGFLAGLDRPVGDAGTRVGFMVGHDETWLTDAQGGKASMGATRIGLYASQPLGKFVLKGDVLGSILNGTTSRASGAGYASATPHGYAVSGGMEISRPFGFAGALFTPAAGVRFSHLEMSGFSEQAPLAAFALTAGASHATSVKPFINLTIAKNFATESGFVITPRLAVGMSYEAGNPNQPVSLTAADGTGFAVNGAHLAPLAADLAASVSVTRGNLTLSAGYAATISGNNVGQAVTGQLSFKF